MSTQLHAASATVAAGQARANDTLDRRTGSSKSRECRDNSYQYELVGLGISLVDRPLLSYHVMTYTLMTVFAAPQ